MQAKNLRQRSILRLVRARSLSTQGELRDALRGDGHAVDQATISRDIRELGLVKVADPERGYRYGVVEEVSPPIRGSGLAVLGRFVRETAATGSLIVVKTDPGTAATVGEALDRIGFDDIIGTVAGDNTLFVAVREGVKASRVLKRIRAEISG